MTRPAILLCVSPVWKPPWSALHTQPLLLQQMACTTLLRSGFFSDRLRFVWAAADGDEGGRHQLITAAVGNGTLYILKVQIGDKRWFKGAKKDAEG